MPSLYMILIGATPPGRNIEQHDMFFGIAESIKDLIPELKSFWPEAKGKLHLDAWREVRRVNDYAVSIVEANKLQAENSAAQLFFINLGGYKQNEFEEFHYKMLVAASDKGAAVNAAKQTAFYKHTGFKGANSHIDDKYGVDVDDIFEIEDILPAVAKERYKIVLQPASPELPEDEMNLGYFKLDTVDKWATIRSDASSQKSSPE